MRLSLLKTLSLVGVLCVFKTAAAARYEIVDSWDVAQVLGDFYVQFSLITHGKDQYVVFYGEDRSMTVGKRTLDTDVWEFHKLPTKIGRDNHNYITAAVDQAGHLHVSGNMHNTPLRYFRTTVAGDITSMKQYQTTTGIGDTGVTYPIFFKAPNGDVAFTHREGSSGRGKRHLKIYDAETQQWSHALEGNLPIADGEGSKNVYPVHRAPILGPDGWYHYAFLWRKNTSYMSNHNMCYVRSKDLKHWENAFGETVKIPITPSSANIIVDPIERKMNFSQQGLTLGVSETGPIIRYKKWDKDKIPQIYIARAEGTEWNIQQVSHFTQEDFPEKTASLKSSLSMTHLERVEEGVLGIGYENPVGKGYVFIDDATLTPASGKFKRPTIYPDEMEKLDDARSNMRINRFIDVGDSGDPAIHYLIQWETMKGASKKNSATTTMRLYKLKRNEAFSSAKNFIMPWAK